MQTRICSKCEESKPIEEFHKDTKGKDGRAARCKTCKNGSRNFKTVETPSKKKETIVVPIEEETELLKQVKSAVRSIQEENLLDRLSERFGETFTITVKKDGKACLQVHGSPQTSYKEKTVTDLLEKVMC